MSSALHSPEFQVFRSLLIEARKKSGLTQVQVAARLGKPQSYVSKFECGERRLDFPEFVKMADILGIDAAAFIEAYKAAVTPKTRHPRKPK